uniref:AAA domain-containing protein n=1 Tax=Bursaphelenchus xylophilus TaxID=6326 RepID=A0A1I7RXS9_BURXY
MKFFQLEREAFCHIFDTSQMHNDDSTISTTVNADIKCLEKEEQLVRQTTFGDFYVKIAEIKNGRPEFRCFYSDLASSDSSDKYQLREGKQRLDVEQVKIECFNQQNESLFSDVFFSLQPKNHVANNSEISDNRHRNYSFAFLNLNGISKSDLISKMPLTVDALETINTQLLNGFHSAENIVKLNDDLMKKLMKSAQDDGYITMLNTMSSSTTFDITPTFDLSSFNKYLLENSSQSHVQCSEHPYERVLNVLKRFLSKYPSVPTFSITDLDVSDLPDLGALDSHLSHILDRSYLNGGFERTVFVITGQKANSHPFLGLTIPRSFFGINPEKYSILLKNKNSFVLLDDVYATVNEIMGKKVDNGVSFLQEISVDRDCEGMKVGKEQCQCIKEAPGRIDDVNFVSNLSSEAKVNVENALNKLECPKTFSISNITDLKRFESIQGNIYQATVPLDISWELGSLGLQVEILFDNNGKVLLKPYIKHADSKCTVKILDHLCHCRPGHGAH